MMMMLITGLVSLGVGLLIGWTGVAGFLLPIFFTGYLKLDIAPALALSFICFALSGVIGAQNYKKAGKLPIRPSLYLGAGSLAGALAGAMLNSLIPSDIVKILLYVVVLLSGLSILLRKNKTSQEDGFTDFKPMMLAVLGLVTGVICALSGAGGPVLVMPLLILIGFGAHTAIGIALFDSVFISLPAAVVYLSHGFPPLSLIVWCGLTHAAGVYIGSCTACRVPAVALKRIVGVGSVCIAVFMLFRIL